MTFEPDPVDELLNKVDKPAVENIKMFKASWDFGTAVDKYLRDSFNYIFDVPPVVSEVEVSK